jgi:hypothetical protein
MNNKLKSYNLKMQLYTDYDIAENDSFDMKWDKLMLLF